MLSFLKCLNLDKIDIVMLASGEELGNIAPHAKALPTSWALGGRIRFEDFPSSMATYGKFKIYELVEEHINETTWKSNEDK